MRTEQTSGEQKEKSLGHADPPLHEPATAAATHGEARHDLGFDLVQLIAEYRALRASVLRLWARQGETPGASEFKEMIRFNEAIDQAIAESVASYSDELGRARDTFTAILGHDLRSPLGAILMSAHNAASHDLPDSAARAIATIQRSARVMQVMIRDLLDFAGTRLGREMPMRPEPSSLIETCHAALGELMAAHPSRTFEFEHDGEVRGHFDPARIGQALSNLLNNAINHGERGHPVSMRASSEDQDLAVTITNKGRTLPPEALRAMMDPGARLQLPSGEGSSGLGLGLYIAQQVARAHGGTVSAVSQEGETRFCLRFPARA